MSFKKDEKHKKIAARNFLKGPVFISDSQRKRVGRKNLVFGSKMIAVVAGFVFLSSVGVGAFFLNKSERSSAAAYYYTPVSAVNPPGTMVVGQTAVVTYVLRNDGSTTWYGEGHTNPTRLGASTPNDRSSPFHSVDAAWIGQTRIRMQESVVSPGQNATFRFVVTARAQGSYVENFNLVTEGIVWHPTRGLFFNVTVPPPTYTYDPVSAVNPPGTMETGQTANVSITVRNTGNYVWHGEGSPNPVRLATSSPNDRASGFAVPGAGWISANRVRLSNGPVLPGQNAVFNFTIEVPPNYYESILVTERFNVVAEGKSWMPERGLFFSISVAPAMAMEDLVGDSCSFRFNVSNSSTMLPQTYRSAPYFNVRSSGTQIVNDGSAIECRTAALTTTGSYVEHVFTAPETAKYRLTYSAKGKSYNGSNARVKAKVSVGFTSRETEHLLTDGYGFRDIPFLGGEEVTLGAGQKIVARVTYINDDSQRYAYVNTIELRQQTSARWSKYIAPRATEDRIDQVPGNSLHIIYAVPSGAKDRQLDTRGILGSSVIAMSDHLRSQTSKSLKIDTFNTVPDVSFMTLSRDAAYYSDKDVLRIMNEVKFRFNQKNKKYLVFIEARGPNRACGFSKIPSKYPIVYLAEKANALCASHHFWNGVGSVKVRPDLFMLHELFHALGHINSCAKNYNNLHLTDDTNDLMYFRGGYNIDSARNDYLSPKCGLLDSPFLR